MLEAKSKTIGGQVYNVRQLDAVQGRRAFTRLSKVLVPGFSQLTAKSDDDGRERFMKAVIGVVQTMTEDDVDYFCELFGKTTEVAITSEGPDGKLRTRSPKLSEIFAVHFVGKYAEMIEWLVFCVEVNFGNFLVATGLTSATSAPVTP